MNLQQIDRGEFERIYHSRKISNRELCRRFGIRIDRVAEVARQLGIKSRQELIDEQRGKVGEWFNSGLSIQEIAERLNVAKSTARRYLREALGPNPSNDKCNRYCDFYHHCFSQVQRGATRLPCEVFDDPEMDQVVPAEDRRLSFYPSLTMADGRLGDWWPE